MLKHYDVTIEGDRIQWLGEKPKAQTLRAILIIEEEPSPSTQTKRTTPAHLIGKGKTLGDIVSSILEAYSPNPQFLRHTQNHKNGDLHQELRSPDQSL